MSTPNILGRRIDKFFPPCQIINQAHTSTFIKDIFVYFESWRIPFYRTQNNLEKTINSVSLQETLQPTIRKKLLTSSELESSRVPLARLYGQSVSADSYYTSFVKFLQSSPTLFRNTKL